MKHAYDELMERVEVTEEMRARILENLQNDDLTPEVRTVRFSALRRYLSLAACFVLLLAGAVTLPRLLDRTEPGPPVLAGPNIVEAASLDELSGLVGFQVTENFTLPFAVETTAYCAYWNEMADIEYSGGGCSARYRQSPGGGDNSGDYNAYGDSTELTAGGVRVTLKGDGGRYVLAVWTDGEYSYSLFLSPGVGEAEWRDILGQQALRVR